MFRTTANRAGLDRRLFVATDYVHPASRLALGCSVGSYRISSIRLQEARGTWTSAGGFQEAYSAASHTLFCRTQEPS